MCYPKPHMYFPPVYLLPSVAPGKRCSELAFLGKTPHCSLCPCRRTWGAAGNGPGELAQGNSPLGTAFGWDRLTSWDKAGKKKGVFFPVSEMASVIRRKLIKREITERTLVLVPEWCPVGRSLGLVPRKLWCFAPGAVKLWKCSHCCNKYSFISDLSNAGGALSSLS